MSELGSARDVREHIHEDSTLWRVCMGTRAQPEYTCMLRTDRLLSRPNTGYGKEHGGGGMHKRGDS